YSAFFELNKSKRLARSDFLRLIESSTLNGVRASAVHHLDWSDLGGESRDLAIRLLNDPNQAIRRCAVFGVRRSRIPERAPMLIDCLEKEDDADIIDSLLAGLGELADPAASSLLLRFARAGDDFHRLNALESLIRIGDGRAMEIATGMLEEERKPVRR